MALHLENFVSIRKLYPRITERPGSTPRLAVADPANATERDYRDLLSEANLNFFHREYSIALQNYLSLRHKILEQSHPEMPRLPGIGGLFEFDWNKVDLKQIAELSRRVVATKPLEGPAIRFALSDERLIQPGETRPNPVFERWSKVGLDLKEFAQPDGLLSRNQARQAVKGGQLDDAVRQYTLGAEQAQAGRQLQLAADLSNECAAMLAAFASGRKRPAALRSAHKLLEQAEQLYTQTGDTEALEIVHRNRALLRSDNTDSAGLLVRNGTAWQLPKQVLDPALVSSASMAVAMGLFSPRSANGASTSPTSPSAHCSPGRRAAPGTRWTAAAAATRSRNTPIPTSTRTAEDPIRAKGRPTVAEPARSQAERCASIAQSAASQVVPSIA